MSLAQLTPVVLYGSRISYFSGKLENYLRLKGIPYEFRPLTFPDTAKLIEAKTGSTQMPALELADGRWMTDSTPIIAWFEAQFPQHSVMPSDPVQRFFALLLEDYADEWLWRPAMHYRWYYDKGARFASTQLVEELLFGIPAPKCVKRYWITRRQRRGYTAGDGIGPAAVAGVEGIYLRTLAQLETILRRRPFLLGDSPSLIDVGFSGPMFRHFGLDPVPAEIMRQQAPAVNEWMARLWNSGPTSLRQDYVSGIPEDFGPLLDEIGEHYLPYLSANVTAVAKNQTRFDADIGDVPYRGARSSRYRVWCLATLRQAFSDLDARQQQQTQTILERHGCWEPMWRDADLSAAEGLCDQLPFHADAKMIDVYE